MKFLFSILVLQIAVSSAFADFTCKVSDKKSSMILHPPSEQETYMGEGRFKGLEFNTIKNEAGDSYSVNVLKGSKLLVATTIPFYADADLKFRHKDAYFMVSCTK